MSRYMPFLRSVALWLGDAGRLRDCLRGLRPEAASGRCPRPHRRGRNDEVITRNDLDERVKLAYAQLKRQSTPPPPRDVLEKQLLERLIIDRVSCSSPRKRGCGSTTRILTAPFSA